VAVFSILKLFFRTATIQNSKILALPEGVSTTNRQLTPQIYRADCEARLMVP